MKSPLLHQLQTRAAHWVPHHPFDHAPLSWLATLNAPLLRSTRLRWAWLAAVLGFWTTFILGLRWFAWHTGITIGDIHLFANALHNTDFEQQWLYFAEYHASRQFITLLQDHFEPTLMLLTYPVQWFGSFALIILSTAIALVPALLIYVAVRRAFPLAPLAAIAAAWAFLTNDQYMLAVTSYFAGFYPEFLQLVLIPAAIAALIRQRYVTFWALVLLSLGVKETAGLIWIGLGAALFLIEGRRALGFSLALISGLIMVYAVLIFPGHFGGVNIYLHLGTSAARDSAGDGWHVFLNEWITPLIEVWPAFLAPTYVLAVLPDIALLSSIGKHSHQHYVLPIFAMLAAGVLVAMPRFAGWSERRPWLPAIAVVILSVHVLIGAFHGLHQTVRPLFKMDDHWAQDVSHHVTSDAVKAAFAAIDTTCGVAADMPLFRHVNHVPRLYGSVDWPTAEHARYWLTIDGPYEQMEKWRSLHSVVQERDGFTPLGRFGEEGYGQIHVWQQDAVPCVVKHSSTMDP